MRMMILALAAAATVGTALPAAAQTVNQREVRQQQRIRQGVRTGQLTRAEAQRLRYLELRLRRTQARLRWRHGGRLTAQDRQRLQAMERRDNAEIYRLKHNYRYRR
jgi:predicted transglutaminase-like cysteine proteinase